MSVQSFIESMPKVDLTVRLEGALSKSTITLIADQNDVADTTKHYNTWLRLLEKPEYDRLDELIRVVSGWVRIPEDLTRFVYDAATALHKQNVRYAEIAVSPSLYTELNITLEQFFDALNDGRSRAQRAWGIEVGWILSVPREEPRKADDYARFASTAAARRAGVVALGLFGKENVQPVGQFERAFSAAEKKGLARIVAAGDVQGADGILKAIGTLLPNRIAGGWGVADSSEVIDALIEQKVALDISMARAVLFNKVPSYAAYPLRKLFDDGVLLTIGTDMPMLFKTTLSQQYAEVVNTHKFEVSELEELALNAVRASFLADDLKSALDQDFRVEYERLRDEHIASQKA